MKKQKWMVLMSVITMLALSACSNAAEDTTAWQTDEVYGAEKEIVTIQTVEKLTETVQTAMEQMSEKQSTQIHVLEARKTQAQEETAGYGEVTIYYGNGASSVLKTEVTELEQLTAENLIAALAKHNIVSLDTKVNAFEEQDLIGKKRIYLDLSKSFREYLKTMTKEGESIIVASVTDTFLGAYHADELVLMVDGKELQTNHASYEEPLVFYETEQVLETQDLETTEY